MKDKNDTTHKLIIEAASDLLAKEGYEQLSMRKIAKQIGYSPGILYHYFKDKAEIVQTIVSEGYGRILSKISQTPINQKKPEETIVSIFKQYIEMMLEIPEQYKAILMNPIEGIKEQVNILDRGIAKERKSIASLCSLLELGMKQDRFIEMDVELTAQIIWTSTHGLLSRLILESEIEEVQRKRLIDHHLKMIILSITI